jgi:hypothetical protein
MPAGEVSLADDARRRGTLFAMDELLGEIVSSRESVENGGADAVGTHDGTAERMRAWLELHDELNGKKRRRRRPVAPNAG